MNDFIEHQIYELVDKLSAGEQLSEALQLLLLMAISEGKLTISEAVEFFSDYLVVTKAK